MGIAFDDVEVKNRSVRWRQLLYGGQYFLFGALAYGICVGYAQVISLLNVFGTPPRMPAVVVDGGVHGYPAHPGP